MAAEPGVLAISTDEAQDMVEAEEEAEEGAFTASDGGTGTGRGMPPCVQNTDSSTTAARGMLSNALLTSSHTAVPNSFPKRSLH